MNADLLKASEQTTVDKEQFLLLEDLYETVEKHQELLDKNIHNQVMLTHVEKQLEKALADIEELKLIAEDVTKSEQERLNAAQSAFKIENDLLNKRIANAEENLRIIKEENAIGESMAEDLDREAQAEIDLFTIRQESTTKQIELNNKINAIKKEQENMRDQELKYLKKLDEHMTEYL